MLLIRFAGNTQWSSEKLRFMIVMIRIHGLHRAPDAPYPSLVIAQHLYPTVWIFPGAPWVSMGIPEISRVTWQTAAATAPAAATALNAHTTLSLFHNSRYIHVGFTESPPPHETLVKTLNVKSHFDSLSLSIFTHACIKMKSRTSRKGSIV